MKLASLLIYACLTTAPAFTMAGPASFALDTPNSFLTISGSVGGSAITQQGAGSLRSTYVGNVLANLSSSQIELISGNSMDANVSGTWQPKIGGTSGSDLADYGGKFKVLTFFDAFFAVRGLILSTSSSPLALSSTGTFASTGVNVTADAGNVDYNVAIASQSGSGSLNGSTGPNGSTTNSTLGIAIAGSGATATLLIPAAAALTFTDPTLGAITLNLSGQLRGTVTTIGGDANFDKIVDIADFSTLASNFNLPGSWLAGNFDGTGNIDIADFSKLAANFNQTAPADLPRGTVPEPAGVLLLSAATLLLNRQPRRRNHRLL